MSSRTIEPIQPNFVITQRFFVEFRFVFNGIYQPVYWINAFNSRAGAVTLADLLALSVFETKNVKRIV